MSKNIKHIGIIYRRPSLLNKKQKEYVSEILLTLRCYQSDYVNSDILDERVTEILGEAVDKINELESELEDEQEYQEHPEYFEEPKLEARDVLSM